MALQRGAAAACQQRKAVAQPVGDLLHAHRLDARRRQLERERNAVELMAQARHR